MTPLLAQRLADGLGCILPTRRMVDQIYAAATCRLAPAPIPPSPEMTTVPVFALHDSMVTGQRAAHPAPAGEPAHEDRHPAALSKAAKETCHAARTPAPQAPP